MAYDNPQHRSYVLPLFDFGGGAAETFSIRGPVGKKGVIREIGVSVTEVFATDASVGSVALGTAADADAFALLNIPDATADNDYFDTSDDTDAIIAEIPADTLVRITLTNGTDGTAVTGQGIPSFVIDWF